MAENIIVPRRREDFFDSDGNPTLRFIRFLESLTDITNTTTTEIITAAFATGFSSQIQSLQRQLDGLPEFTIDTSGFTTDLTFITTDKVIA
ncbi:MAG: hypothetical protein HRU18_00940 [Pseudoalteromonas sp.]|uniref:hypothetical protein n=1 Tax=Pseudoalteromonas sp. TaxID=53249 RepID=UPI001DC0625B|nr:hypothetical protein [Pseudoalteromonas sp.]NRA76746.1 hypothetical protein [Pseudoalteromonas sp.]